MKENWTCESYYTESEVILIICSNYFLANEVVNYQLSDLNLRNKNDIGVWKIKTKK